MAWESELHRRLKRSACAWLWEQGLTAIAEEVAVPGVGIIDVAAAGKRRRRNPHRASYECEPGVDRHHVVFIECKALRADFLRDRGHQHQFAFALSERSQRRKPKRRIRPRHASQALGKFDTCLVRPHANLHYLMTPRGLIRAHEIPRRWGLLLLDNGRVRVVRRSAWQETAAVNAIEGAIARSLTAQRMRDVTGRDAPLTHHSDHDPTVLLSAP